MDKTMRQKNKTIIFIILFIISIVTIKRMMINPKPVREINTNKVYICGFETRYPSKNQSRYYIEFKDDKTFILMHDDTRRNAENYDEDGDGSYPTVKMYYGKYEIKNNKYILKIKESVGVSFKDVAAVKKKKIYYYGHGVFDTEQYIAEQNSISPERNIFINGKGQYILGYPNKNSSSYDEGRDYYTLYNKSDIKKLPSSPEEFRKQFKMDKKTEQERLAEQNR